MGLTEDTYIKVMGEKADLFQHQLESYSFQQQPESHFISHRAARRLLLLTKVATCVYSSKIVSYTNKQGLHFKIPPGILLVQDGGSGAVGEDGVGTWGGPEFGLHSCLLLSAGGLKQE